MDDDKIAAAILTIGLLQGASERERASYVAEYQNILEVLKKHDAEKASAKSLPRISDEVMRWAKRER